MKEANTQAKPFFARYLARGLKVKTALKAGAGPNCLKWPECL